MFGQSLLVKIGTKALLGALGADPLTQNLVSTGVGWVTSALTFDHHSQVLGHIHDLTAHATSVHDIAHHADTLRSGVETADHYCWEKLPNGSYCGDLWQGNPGNDYVCGHCTHSWDSHKHVTPHP
jgi:hypothetical protein